MTHIVTDRYSHKCWYCYSLLSAKDTTYSSYHQLPAFYRTVSSWTLNLANNYFTALFISLLKGAASYYLCLPFIRFTHLHLLITYLPNSKCFKYLGNPYALRANLPPARPAAIAHTPPFPPQTPPWLKYLPPIGLQPRSPHPFKRHRSPLPSLLHLKHYKRDP